ncbi:hypothetical protein B0H67DRAFT_323180 [Lasiosphaeris hirsuta]|uniref:ATPase AAA-type core domain-containing protein n=1 Tax=Lasiosphaeris hirsuta TaxID=260670 RepID=A0AA40A1Y8_9PEZI|nr:hypothetical protein B0H67DRAFT_323180 [Lasiosphaeris hirsuta]
MLCAGDLGTTAESVEASLETSLETNFSLANRWGCILLLDEADVFLAKRTPQDFKRNGLVSVFLRVLEYYAGVLSLTTNRISDIDEAFGSRIHISLHYPQLTQSATKEMFELNLRLIKQRFAEKNRKLEVEEQLILDAADRYWKTRKKMRWNGNVFCRDRPRRSSNSLNSHNTTGWLAATSQSWHLPLMGRLPPGFPPNLPPS